MTQQKVPGQESSISMQGKTLREFALREGIKHGKLILKDLVHALKTDRSAQILAGLLIFCIIGWNIPIVSWLLYPFKLFVTMVHESSHALAARLTGGQVSSVSISADESGLTESYGGFRPLVACAGYMGTAIFGGLLIYLGRKANEARSVLHTVGWVLLSMTIFYGGGGYFSFISMLLISISLILIAKHSEDKTCHMVLLIMAVITTIEAILDFRTLMILSVIPDAANDARTMAMLTGIPRTIWTLLYGAFSITVLFLSFWLAYRPREDADLSSRSIEKEAGSTKRKARQQDPSIEQELET